MRNQKKITITTFFLFVVICLNISALNIQFISSIQSHNIQVSIQDFDYLIKNANKTAMEEHVKFLSNCGSRTTGYPGFSKAATYIAQRFEKYGVKQYSANGYFESFNITVPIDKGSSVTLEDGRTISAYTLWPNLVSSSIYKSPREGDELIYLESKNPDRFPNIDVKDKFVLMDFNSRWFFRFPIIYGAKGLIFVPEDESLITRDEAEQKLMQIPLPVPRLYIPLEEGGREIIETVKQHSNSMKVFIDANSDWESLEVSNIVGFVKGTDPKLSDKVIVITAYYDSWSIVPALSPGATDALGIAALLEFSWLISLRPPKYSVIFLANAGHWQSLWGAREFVESHFSELKTKIVAFAGIDLSSDSQAVGVFSKGSSYSYTYPKIIDSRYDWLVKKFFGEYLMNMQLILGPDYGQMFIDGIQLTYPPYISQIPFYQPGRVTVLGSVATQLGMALASSNLMLDSDPFVVASYGGGFTYKTVNAFRSYQRTPSDLFGKIEFDNVWPQICFIFCTLWGLMNEPEINLFMKPLRGGDDWGYATLTVQVSEYNFLTAYYDDFNATRHPELWRDVIVRFTGFPVGGIGIGAPTVGGVTGGLEIIIKPDAEGKAVIHGVKAYFPGYVDAFVVNRTNGHIEWATDIGVFMAPQGKLVPMTTPDYFKIISMFPCASIYMLSFYVPTDLRSVSSILVYDQRAHGPMIRQSMMLSDLDAVAFVQPNVPAEILFTMGERFPVTMLINATKEKPSGTGYALKEGESMLVSPQDYAKNIYFLSTTRYGIERKSYAFNPSSETFFEYASSQFERLTSSQIDNSLKNMYGYAYNAWAFSLLLYNSVMSLMWEVLTTLTFFFILAFLCSVILERLFFEYSGVKRLIVISTLFVLFQALLSMFHPGYTLATNAPVVLLSVCMLIVVVPLVVIIINEATSKLKSLRTKIVGLHFTEISRSAFVSQSFSTGMQHLKKTRFRSTLTFLSVILIVFAMVAFTSVTISPTILHSYLDVNPSYEGIMVKRPLWNPIPEEVYFSLKMAMAGQAYVAPRAWLYAPPLPAGTATSVGQPYIAFTPKRQNLLTSLLALTPEESNVSQIDKLLVPGKGRWFMEGDQFCVILPDNLADRLTKEMGEEVSAGSTIRFWGMNLKVIGIINSSQLDDFIDVNGEPITPVNVISAQLTVAPHYLGNQIMIIPYSLYTKLVFPSYVANIAIKPYNISISSVAEQVSLRFSLDVYCSTLSGTSYIRARQWFQVIGGMSTLPPVAIAAMTILSLMLGNVHTRRDEIKIFNSVGMSPVHISLMFLTESLVYAIPSCLFGYLFGVIVTATLLNLGIYPTSLYPNFSSMIMLVVTGLSLAVVVSSSLYPSFLVGRLAVPSMEIRYKVTKPKGDNWVIPLPFVATMEKEARGIFYFFYEYFKTYTMQRATAFSVEDIRCLRGISSFGEPTIRLTMNVRLAPYELNVTQESELQAVSKKGIYNILLVITRKTGHVSTWENSNRTFIDAIRKQMLYWRALTPSQRDDYINTAAEELSVVMTTNE